MPDLKVSIIYVAEERDWNVDDVLDGRGLSNPEAQKDLIEMFKEDLPYIFANATFKFSYEHTGRNTGKPSGG